MKQRKGYVVLCNSPQCLAIYYSKAGGEKHSKENNHPITIYYERYDDYYEGYAESLQFYKRRKLEEAYERAILEDKDYETKQKQNLTRAKPKEICDYYVEQCIKDKEDIDTLFTPAFIKQITNIKCRRLDKLARRR